MQLIRLAADAGVRKRRRKSPARKLRAMEYLTPRDVAELLQISTRSAQRLMATGAIASFRVGSKLWRTSGEALAQYAVRCHPSAAVRLA